MWQETSETVQPLRSGLTTGSCATACCVAACKALLSGDKPETVEILLPRGKTVQMTVSGYQALASDRTIQNAGNAIRVETIKDAGDDPDATHGATVFVELRLIDNINQSEVPNVVFKAADGVGTVTKAGLLLDIGEPAINPVPRKMMTEHLVNYAETYHYQGGFEVSVGVENGEQIAKKTMNGRLGILGGLSILGTTGIVRPYSCAAYIASIRQGVDVAASNGLEHIAASTGSSSEKAITSYYQLSDTALIEMGDFAGALLKHLKKITRDAPQIKKLSICGGFGKMTKLAQGALDLNSRKSSIDFQFLHDCMKSVIEQQNTDIAAQIKQQMLQKVLTANTSIEVLSLAQKNHIALADYICYLAQQHALSIVNGTTEQLSHESSDKIPNSNNQMVQVEVFAINRQGEIISMYDPYGEGDFDTFIKTADDLDAAP